MNNRERSLRCLVEKWLGPASTTPVRVIQFSHSRRKQWRYVCVEATHLYGTFSYVFFRHDDGSWCVFPPESRRPSTRLYSINPSTVPQENGEASTLA
jgi:hypothetical protein